MTTRPGLRIPLSLAPGELGPLSVRQQRTPATWTPSYQSLPLPDIPGGGSEHR